MLGQELEAGLHHFGFRLERGDDAPVEREGPDDGAEQCQDGGNQADEVERAHPLAPLLGGDERFVPGGGKARTHF